MDNRWHRWREVEHFIEELQLDEKSAASLRRSSTHAVDLVLAHKAGAIRKSRNPSAIVMKIISGAGTNFSKGSPDRKRRAWSRSRSPPPGRSSWWGRGQESYGADSPGIRRQGSAHDFDHEGAARSSGWQSARKAIPPTPDFGSSQPAPPRRRNAKEGAGALQHSPPAGRSVWPPAEVGTRSASSVLSPQSQRRQSNRTACHTAIKCPAGPCSQSSSALPLQLWIVFPPSR
eukprot:TRINITY_DN19427_c0_g1_i2.p1 TRINITY_DN19427_c0_g1~~TRINITY_DN19427_c0_g1_i2.p1  ORF type:complete len:231 (+),score=23.73 TRINITY_DN19427_c0_g1_i2:75-767(+)